MTGEDLFGVARAKVTGALRSCDVPYVSDDVGELAAEAVCRTLENYDPERCPTPLPLLDYKVKDVVAEHVRRGMREVLVEDVGEVAA